MKKLGVIINPIAGLGGSVGLKGTDNHIEEALERGAIPRSNARMKQALTRLLPLKSDLTIYTGVEDLGETTCYELGFSCVINDQIPPLLDAQTSKDLCYWMQAQGVDLILFAGGDGTARDLYESVSTSSSQAYPAFLGAPADSSRIPPIFLGVPAGVKIHSSVYAITPYKAGELALLYLKGLVRDIIEEEVMDIDEEEYRKEHIHTRLYGYLHIPLERQYTQSRKSPSPMSEESTFQDIATRIIASMEENTYYLIGAGTTTRAIMNQLQLENTLIGVDLIQNKTLIQKDVYGQQLLNFIDTYHLNNHPLKLIVTITGGQGFLFGRGNQQLTPEVLRRIGKENIIIIASKEKLIQLRGKPLIIDTGDDELDSSLRGFYRVIVSSREEVMVKAIS